MKNTVTELRVNDHSLVNINIYFIFSLYYKWFSIVIHREVRIRSQVVINIMSQTANSRKMDIILK